jgi:hypothetical protein
VRVDAQAVKVAISIISTKKWITIFLFFITFTPPCKFVVKLSTIDPFLITGWAEVAAFARKGQIDDCC